MRNSNPYPMQVATCSPALTFAALDTIALTLSDNEAARQMNAAKTQLFNAIFGTGKRVA